MKRIAIAGMSCAGTLLAIGCISLGGLTADATDASTADGAGTPDAILDAPVLTTDAGSTDATATPDAFDAGPPFQRVFVTSAATTGNLGGLAGADARCSKSAGDAKVLGVYKAILSDPSGAARDRITFTLPIRVVQGDGTALLVANDAADLWDGALAASIDRDEYGAKVAAGPVWTGSGTNGGLPGTAHCSAWTNGATTASGWAGNLIATNRDWVISNWGPQMYTSLSCEMLARLYCIEQ